MLDLTVDLSPGASVDPARALWAQHGHPLPDLAWQSSNRSDEHTCSRCQHRTGTWVRISEVVSDRFTGWDAYATGERMPHWCPPCAWAHSETRLRHFPWIINRPTGARAQCDQDGEGQQGPAAQAAPARAGDLRALLLAPLAASTAVLVPLSRKKHLLPAAVWGTVRTDDLNLTWGPPEAARLGVLLALRAMGFSEAAVGEPAPRFEHLRRCSTADQVSALSTWSVLDPWRDYPPLMAVALRAARTERP